MMRIKRELIPTEHSVYSARIGDFNKISVILVAVIAKDADVSHSQQISTIFSFILRNNVAQLYKRTSTLQLNFFVCFGVCVHFAMLLHSCFHLLSM